jgi:uncharacterized membrane protein YhaH (DUF805 family)
MGFQDAVRSVFSKYVTISGRATRSEYWWWVLFVVLAQIVLGIVDSVLFGASATESPGSLATLFRARHLPAVDLRGRTAAA